jgi:protein-S-isoprenylcysteine O-methyltransferase Ste14
MEKDRMFCRWLKAVLLIPFNVLVVIPAIVLALSGYHWSRNHAIWLTAGSIIFVLGLGLAVWTTKLFNERGKGTALPWDPPQFLVVAGPYRYVRNPMIISVLMMLVGEALLLNSIHIFCLFILFLLGKMVYLPLFEEKSLEKRFGSSYLAYRNGVPRWIPRLRPWDGQA